MTAPTDVVAGLDADVQQLLQKYDFLEVIEVVNSDPKRIRVRCQLTQHEMMPRVDAIESYCNSKKFQKAKDWYCYDYSKYEPYIVAHRRKPKCLYCNVTGKVLNRIPTEVEKHVNGKKYKRLKEHVTIQVKNSKRSEGDNKGDDGEEQDDFDADAFEFENSQVLYSDDEGDEAESSAKRSKRKGSDDEDDDDDDEEEEDEVEEEYSDGEGEDDMADLYPDDDDEEDENARPQHVVALETKERNEKKRKAASDDDDNATHEDTDKQANTNAKQKKVHEATGAKKQSNQNKRSKKQRKRQKTTAK